MAQIIPLGSTIPVIIDDKAVCAALFNEVNNSAQNDIITINGVQYKFSTLVMSGGNIGIPQLLGTITGAELNAMAANASVSKTFAGAKPANKAFGINYGGWIKTTTAFSSPTRNIDVVSLSTTYTQAAPNATGTYFILASDKTLRSIAEDLIVTLTFSGGGVNPKDFNPDAQFQIWATIVDIPTLS